MRLTVLLVALCVVACKNDLAEIEKLGDEVCACKELACTDEKMGKIADLAKKAAAGKSDKELKEFADRLEEQRGRMKKCVDDLKAAAAPPAAAGGGHGDAPSDEE